MSDSGDEFEFDEEAAAAAAAAAAEAAAKLKTAGKVAAKDNPMQELIKKRQEKEAEHQAKLDKLLGEVVRRARGVVEGAPAGSLARR